MQKNDLLKIEYIPITKAAEFWDENPKLHDIDKIIASIKKNGFVNPPKYDPSLNKGSGGLVFGNGRTESILKMYEDGMDVPRGIAIAENGEWCIPVLFGVDAESESAAKALAIDDNSLTMSGGDFTGLDLSKLYDQDMYLQILEDLQSDSSLPVSVDEHDLQSLIDFLEQTQDNEANTLEFNKSQPDDSFISPESEDDYDQAPVSSVRMVQLFLNSQNHPEFLQMVEDLIAVYKVSNLTDCVIMAVQQEHERNILNT